MSILVIPTNASKFPLGDVVITANAHRQLDPFDVQKAMCRHASGDWGEVCEEDRKANELSLELGSRLLSAYRSNGKRFWIITEADRSVTTILMPQDY